MDVEIIKRLEGLEALLLQIDGYLRPKEQADPDFSTEKELCARYKVSRTTIQNWEYRAILQPILIGRSKRYRAEDIIELERNNHLVKRARGNGHAWIKYASQKQAPTPPADNTPAQ